MQANSGRPPSSATHAPGASAWVTYPFCWVSAAAALHAWVFPRFTILVLVLSGRQPVPAATNTCVAWTRLGAAAHSGPRGRHGMTSLVRRIPLPFIFTAPR